jgi:hypothetical protein
MRAQITNKPALLGTVIANASIIVISKVIANQQRGL